MCREHCTTTKNVNNKNMLHKKTGIKSTFTEPANYVIIFIYRKQKYQFVLDT